MIIAHVIIPTALAYNQPGIMCTYTFQKHLLSLPTITTGRPCCSQRAQTRYEHIHVCIIVALETSTFLSRNIHVVAVCSSGVN